MKANFRNIFICISLFFLLIPFLRAQSRDEFHPIFKYDTPDGLSPSTWRGKLHIALNSPNLKLAKENFEGFVEFNDSKWKGDFQDSPHYRNVITAKFELSRIYFLTGDYEKAEALLQELNQRCLP